MNVIFQNFLLAHMRMWLDIRNRITSYNVCYTKLLRFILQYIDDIDFLNRIQQENLEIAKRLYLSDEAKANKKRLLNVLNSR